MNPAGLQEVLSAGADPNEPDRWGQTPVEVAAQIRGGWAPSWSGSCWIPAASLHFTW